MLAGSITDVLSGSSLVVAVIAAFFTLWQADITTALATPLPEDPMNGDPGPVQQVIVYKLRPLVLISLAAFAVLAPRAILLLSDTAACTVRGGDGCQYDDVAGLFLMTEVLLLGLVLIIGAQLRAACVKRAALTPPVVKKP
jgi:hypothetical protein